MNKQIDKLTDVQIYGPSFSNFVRTVMILCEEYNVSYATGFEFDGLLIEFKSEQHLAIHPYGKLPILKHGDMVLPETNSICRYLQHTFAKDEVNQLSLQQNAHIDSFSAIIAIYVDKAIIRDYLLEFAFPKGEGGEIRFDIAKNAQPAVKEALTVIDAELARGDILNNEAITIADALVAPMLHYLSTLPQGFNLLDEFPKLDAYLTQLMTRESCQKVLVAKS